MNRKSNSRPGRNRPGAPRGARPDAQGHKPVSPNYQVDMMHHRLGSQQNAQGHQGSYGHLSQPSGHPMGQKQSPFRRGPGKKYPAKPPARKGYITLNLEIKDELYKKFTSALKDSSKTPKEVINQLISFYNMGKINI